MNTWLDGSGINTLNDLFDWASSGRWIGWKRMDIPVHLHIYYRALLTLLHGHAPIHKILKDRRSWGKNDLYSVKVGYRMVDKDKRRYLDNNKLNKIRYSDGLPKVNVFFWIFSHCNTLTSDNLRKRGIIGPIRCIMCKEIEENLENLFT